MNLDKFMGSLLAVAVCDSFGVPFETMTSDEIELLELVGYTLDGYFCPSVNPHPFPDVVGKPKGSWSDDWQLTSVTMESLTEAGGTFDMDVLAKKHVEAYHNRDRRGWGRSTKNAAKRLSEGVHWTKSGEPNGGGNGVMMKIAPMGLRESVSNRIYLELIRECIDYARMTHGAFTAITASCVHAYAVSFLAKESTAILLHHDFLKKLCSYAFFVEQYLGPHPEMISEQIALLSDMFDKGQLAKESPREISQRFGGGTKAAFSAFNSFATAYAAFLRNPYSFDCIVDCIRMGGDTDSNAAIAGSLLGALHGASIVPTHFIEELEDHEYIQEKIKIFYRSTTF